MLLRYESWLNVNIKLLSLDLVTWYWVVFHIVVIAPQYSKSFHLAYIMGTHAAI